MACWRGGAHRTGCLQCSLSRRAAELISPRRNVLIYYCSSSSLKKKERKTDLKTLISSYLIRFHLKFNFKAEKKLFFFQVPSSSQIFICAPLNSWPLLMGKGSGVKPSGYCLINHKALPFATCKLQQRYSMIPVLFHRKSKKHQKMCSKFLAWPPPVKAIAHANL